MEVLAFLSIGLAVGMGHALEADHLAAVATMMDRKGGRRSLIARGAFWGLGHTLSLFAICSAVVLLGLTISVRTEAALELAVGVTIVALGAQVLWRLRRRKVHIHVHEHDGVRHIHAHSHAGDGVVHDRNPHRHRHAARRTNLKAAGIGLLHGAAGSAGLLVLMVASTQDAWQALAYFAVFGVGSIAGMAALSAVASYPLVLIQRGAVWMHRTTSAAIGAAAVWVGGTLAFESLSALGHAGF